MVKPKLSLITFFLALVALPVASCMCDLPEETAIRIVEVGGMEVESTAPVRGWLTHCGRGDIYQRSFVAIGANGQRVHGTVCCGGAKDCTVRISP